MPAKARDLAEGGGSGGADGSDTREPRPSACSFAIWAPVSAMCEIMFVTGGVGGEGAEVGGVEGADLGLPPSPKIELTDSVAAARAAAARFVSKSDQSPPDAT